jgi:hypothetical protein
MTRLTRRTSAAFVLVAAALTAAAPAAQSAARLHHRQAAVGNVGTSGCGPANGVQGQGGTGGEQTTVCSGTGAVVIGDQSNVSTATGPTISSPSPAGIVTVSNGDVAMGP